MVDETEFERELELFRKDEEEAQQHFFCWLSVGRMGAANADAARVLNTTPLFWRTTHHAMIMAAFVVLGRVFDQDSEHNLDRLIKVIGDDLSIFSRKALQLRKERCVSKAQAAAFVEDAHEPTSGDIKILKRQVAVRRTAYNDRYRDIRDKVFAHNGVPATVNVDALFAKTKIEEITEMLGFLHALHVALDQLFLNGRKPEVKPYKFNLDLAEPWPSRIRPGERVYREYHEMLKLLVRGERDTDATKSKIDERNQEITT